MLWTFRIFCNKTFYVDEMEDCDGECQRKNDLEKEKRMIEGERKKQRM